MFIAMVEFLSSFWMWFQTLQKIDWSIGSICMTHGHPLRGRHLKKDRTASCMAPNGVSHVLWHVTWPPRQQLSTDTPPEKSPPPFHGYSRRRFSLWPNDRWKIQNDAGKLSPWLITKSKSKNCLRNWNTNSTKHNKLVGKKSENFFKVIKKNVFIFK